MAQIRSFIAIELSGEIKRELTRLQENLKLGSRAPVRWVDPNIIHLTLKFLGDIDENIAASVTDVIEKASGGTRPFQLKISGLGVFPNTRRVQVVWVGLTGELDKLGGLQKSVESGLVPLGFKAESRPFTPHLTIGRVRERARPEERQDLGRLIEGMNFETAASLNVDAVNLMKSQLTREGPIYTRLSSVELKQ